MRKELRCEHIDKSRWGDGLWRAEPDMLQWTDPKTSLLCVAARHQLGFLNGYVGVPENHPAYELPYEAVMAAVHGGLSFAGHCKGIDEECARLWWFGFTCGSYFDFHPATGEGGEYRSLEYVEAECARLAAQLHSEYAAGR
jgi:hypothetical protein